MPSTTRVSCTQCGRRRVICTCSANSQICMYCCLTYYGTCMNCGLGFLDDEAGNRARVERCTCCATRLHSATGARLAVYCRTCCGTRRHPCCNEQIVHVPARPEPRFAFPVSNMYIELCGTDPENFHLSSPELPGVGLTTRDGSVAVSSKLLPLKYINPKGFSRNRSRRFAATEIECSTFSTAKNTNAAVRKWGCAVVHDGSVPNGFEINTTPACGDPLLDQIQELSMALITDGARVDHLCGLHVHVDCRDYGYQEIQRLVKVYSMCEETLFAAIHKSRYANHFCGHCGDRYYKKFVLGTKPNTKELKSKIIGAIYGPEATAVPSTALRRRRTNAFSEVRTTHYGPGGNIRYSALNLHSYFLRGTVEFRMHHGSVEFDEIYNWMKILIDLFDSILKTTDSDLNSLLSVGTKNTKEIIGQRKLSSEQATRIDIKYPQMIKGLVVLNRLLPEDSFENLMTKVKDHTFSPQLVNLPSESLRLTRIAEGSRVTRPLTEEDIMIADLDLDDDYDDDEDDYYEDDSDLDS